MGMVLSAVGACLLFILKVVGILLLILLVLAALLLLCPFCADVCWQNDTLTVKAGALGITFPVFQYPKPEPPAQPEEPKGFTGRLKAKFRAWRAERSAMSLVRSTSFASPDRTLSRTTSAPIRSRRALRQSEIEIGRASCRERV